MTGNIVVRGTIICAPDDVEMLVARVKDHIQLTRLEVGCIAFDIAQSGDDPCVFNVSERFVDQPAFDIHTARTRTSVWWEQTKHIPRDLKITAE